MANITIPSRSTYSKPPLSTAKSCLEMHRQKGNAQFYGQSCREKPREQANDDANGADRFQEHSSNRKRRGGLQSLFGHETTDAGETEGADFQPAMHKQNVADDHPNERVGNVTPGIVKSREARKE